MIFSVELVAHGCVAEQRGLQKDVRWARMYMSQGRVDLVAG